ncbi:MAG: BLUF domain-containing protein [Gammaproteobacteria bacterium SHHR-1]|uniref:BLUF domain-containing protein n=1 Tax=Magnetovirga frankeli TaxID=947516 RepID=UPI001293D1C9|nr:BLUF domain-containing protein [gamma proteobacterium SS-5]
MISLVYVSTATRPISEQELLHILDISRRNNRKLGVTGILLYSGGRFFQVLEGEEKNVLDIYQHIAKNPLHRSPLVLSQGPIQERNFGQWSMGYRHVDSAVDKEQLEGYCALLDRNMEAEEFSKKSNALVDMIYQFKEMM